MNIMHIFKKDQVGDVLQRLYNSEINIEIRSFFDVGFSARLGDDINGWLRLAVFGNNKIDRTNIADTVSAIAYRVFQSFPDSDFATWYKSIEQ